MTHAFEPEISSMRSISALVWSLRMVEYTSRKSPNCLSAEKSASHVGRFSLSERRVTSAVCSGSFSE